MIRFATINIEGQRHLPEVRHFLATLQPDIVCFQEASEEDVLEFAKLLSAQSSYVMLGRSPDAHDPSWEVSSTWGIAILSRFPVRDIQHRFYKGDEEIIPHLVKGNPNAVRRAVLMHELETPGGILKIATTHFTWTPNGETTPEQQRDFAQLTVVLDELQPDLLCGDFNAARGINPVYSELSARYTDTNPAHVTTTIDPVLHRAKNLQLVVDAIFAGPQLHVANVQVHTGVSDHCALTADITAA